MKLLASLIALISLVLIFVNWNSSLAMAWTIAFCGWLPHVFDNDKESRDGHQA